MQKSTVLLFLGLVFALLNSQGAYASGGASCETDPNMAGCSTAEGTPAPTLEVPNLETSSNFNATNMQMSDIEYTPTNAAPRPAATPTARTTTTQPNTTNPPPNTTNPPPNTANPDSSPDKPASGLPPVGSDVADKCTSDVSGLSTSCSLTSSPTTAGVISVGQGIAKIVAASPQEACNGMAQLAVAAQAGVAAFAIACQQAVTTCVADCTLPSGYSDPGNVMGAGVAQCKKAGTQATPDWSVLTQMMGVSSNQLAACQQAVAATSTISAACLADPLAVGCAGYSASDCSNPANAGSATCQCINNPSTCAGAASSTTATPGIAGGPALNGSGTGGGMGGLDGIGGLGTPVAATSSGNNQQPSAGQGGGFGGGAGAAGFGDNSAAAKKPVAAAKNGAAVPSGSLYGGLVSPSGGGSSSGSRGGYGSSGDGGKPVLGSAYVNKPDFNSFRPNMPYNPSRALAGKIAPRDGITGPETNIWDKVKTQFNYQGQQGSFITQ